VCSVSIVRAGATMEQSLRKVVKDIPIGKMLIQTDPATGEPLLHYCKLPGDIQERYVLLSDAQIATGAAALMAIRVLLDHDVPQERIIFLSLIASPLGVSTIAKAFPSVKIVTSEVDAELDDKLYIVPGFGNFGGMCFEAALAGSVLCYSAPASFVAMRLLLSFATDRYFGTE
ncbi:uracil phosphoribosyltransferase-domain-containing protein, partial [Blyttiomyces helicus]